MDTSTEHLPWTSELAPLLALLHEARRRGASDLHLAAGIAPTVRVHGNLTPLAASPLTTSSVTAMCEPLLTPRQRHTIDTYGACDLAFDVPAGGRCRAHLFRQRGSDAAAIRLLTSTLAVDPLQDESWAEHVTGLRHGLVLVTGATGSGKSTTLTALLDCINHQRHVHIVTIEDPIEHLHQPQRALITQRELHRDTASFAEALRGVLREDPDVVLIGEIRDRDTMEAALTVAETGHLVLSSLHTGSAAQAVHRVLDMFPPQDQAPIRAQLAAVIEVVVCQQLVSRTDGAGRVAAVEVLRVTAAIRNLIREGKTHQLDSMMQLGQSQSGTRTMAQALADLQQRGLITADLGSTAGDVEGCAAGHGALSQRPRVQTAHPGRA